MAARKPYMGEVFYHEMQFWANEGYFVFFCNPRGGDGRGNEFADLRGKYGSIDYDDIMALPTRYKPNTPSWTKKRLRSPAALWRVHDQLDHRPHRPFCGGSLPAFHRQLDRLRFHFRHWRRFCKRPNGALAKRVMSGTAWKNCGFTLPCSIWIRCTTPTLFIHSDEDYRCPPVGGVSDVRSSAAAGRGNEDVRIPRGEP